MIGKIITLRKNQIGLLALDCLSNVRVMRCQQIKSMATGNRERGVCTYSERMSG
jgi:hypothetical protein